MFSIITKLFRKKVEAPKASKKKRDPKRWRVPEEHTEEIIRLYDDMMKKKNLHKRLPKYLFWHRVYEILPSMSGIGVKIDLNINWANFYFVEIVPDDEPEFREESIETEKVLTELEQELDKPKQPMKNVSIDQNTTTTVANE
jgi:hypothetical protein